MKTSTILILSAVAMTFIAMTAFNLTQKAFYNKGDWRNRFYGMEYIAIKSITDIDLLDADKFNLVIEKGVKEGLYIYPGSREHVQWSTTGNTLKVEVTEKAKKGAPFRNTEMVLILNRIDHVKTSPYKPLEFQKSYNYSELKITGFKQESLKLNLGKSSRVILDKLDLNSLIANVGGKEDEATLILEKENRINDAVLNIRGKSHLTLQGPTITKTSYQLSDQATVVLNGEALQVLK